MALALASAPVRAADPITPDSANSARFGVEQEGKQLADAGAHEQAAELYWSRGIELKDPVLLIDAAEAWRDQAAAERSTDAAQRAIDSLPLALDMLYYLRDSAVSASWQPVAPEYVAAVIARAESVRRDAEALIAEIEAEREAALAPPEPEPEKRGPAKPGTILIAGGAAALVVGVGGLALGGAGLGIGASAQKDVEDPLVYAAEHAAAEARGRKGNIMAGVGLAIGGVGVLAGTVLVVLGVKKRKASAGSGGDEEARTRVGPLWLGQGGGLVVSGKF